MMKDHFSPRIFSLFFAVVLFIFLGSRAAPASAASLYLSPSVGEYSIGQNFSITVGVASPDQAANAVEGVVSFPADKLEVTAVSKSGSILNLWVKEPSFSNATGTVNFEGIALNPGFTGSAGKIMSISFKTRSAGTAAITFSSGSVLANDGQGTNITSGLGRATITIKGQSDEPVPAPAEPPKPGMPSAPTVTSSSHPDRNAWYDKNIADLRWTLDKNVNGVSVFVDQRPDTLPTAVSDGLFQDYSTKQLDDGIWYFHIRAKNAAGWGPASHYRLQIDTTVPEVVQEKIEDVGRVDIKQPVIDQYSTRLKAGDILAIKGTGGYPDALVRVWVQKGSASIVDATVGTDENGVFYYLVDGKIQPGIYKLWVQASDKNGNFGELSDKVTVVVEKPSWLTVAGREINIWFIVLLVVIMFLIHTVLIWQRQRRFVDHQIDFKKKVVKILRRK